MQCKEFRHYNVFYGVCQEDEGPKKLRCCGAKEQIAVTVEKIAGNTGDNGGKGGQNIQKKRAYFVDSAQNSPPESPEHPPTLRAEKKVVILKVTTYSKRRMDV